MQFVFGQPCFHFKLTLTALVKNTLTLQDTDATVTVGRRGDELSVRPSVLTPTRSVRSEPAMSLSGVLSLIADPRR